MKHRNTVVVAAIMLLASGLAWTLATRQATPNEPPAQLVKSILPSTCGKAVYGDLVRSWFDWATMSMSVTLTRRERQDLSSQWDEQLQELIASYYVVDARVTVDGAQQIKDMYLAGVYPDGSACLERWAFSYPLVQGWPYVPISQRPLPTVRRAELFRGNQYGHIRSIEPDPEGRFLLFLTLENPTLYRKGLPAGAITTELSQSTVPVLANCAQIVARHQTIEGRQFHLMYFPRWEVDLSQPRYIVILKDADNDAVFDPAIVITPETWSALGYDSPGIWSLF